MIVLHNEKGKSLYFGLPLKNTPKALAPRRTRGLAYKTKYLRCGRVYECWSNVESSLATLAQAVESVTNSANFILLDA